MDVQGTDDETTLRLVVRQLSPADGSTSLSTLTRVRDVQRSGRARNANGSQTFTDRRIVSRSAVS